MAEDKIDSIIDRAAITQEIAFLQGKVNEVVDIIKKTKDQSIKFNVDTKTVADYNKGVADLNASLQKMQTSVAGVTAATVKNTQATLKDTTSLGQNLELRRRLQEQLKEVNRIQKEDITLFKQQMINRTEFNRRIALSNVNLATYKAKIQELNRVIKEDIALEGKAGDAYKQLSAEYNRAALAAKNYQIVLGATHPTTVAAVNNAKRLSDELKKVDNSVGQNQRNVGNYASGIQQAFSKTWGFLRTAANVIPGLGIGGLIGGIAVGILELGKALFTTNKEFDRGKEFAKAYKQALTEVNEEAIKGSTADITKLEFYRSILTDVTQSQQNRTEALKAYNKIADESNQLDITQLNNLDLINQKINQQIALIERRALTRAAESILADKAEKLLLEKEKARVHEEENLRLDIEAGRSVEASRYDARTKTFIKSNAELLNIEKKRTIDNRVNATANVKTAQAEFDGTRKALYDLLKVEGFAADETKKIKEKKAKSAKGKDIAEANRKAEFEILKANLELAKEFDLLRAADERKSFVDRISNIINYGADSQRLIEAQAEFELHNADLTAKEREKIENDKNNALIRLTTELNSKMQVLIAEQAKLFGADTAGLAAGLKGMTDSVAKAIAKIQADFAKMQADAIKKAEDLKKALGKAYLDLATELEGLFFDLFQNSIERQKNAVQDQIDLLDRQKDKDIEVANSTITNAQQRADAIAVIEARAASKKQLLEQKQRQLDQQKARFEKAAAITKIVQETAVAVIRTLAEFPGPKGLTLAAVIAAIGAAQLIRAIAQPIPRYAEGTDNHKGGLAVVGDGGKSEGVVMPDGSVYKTPSTDTLVNLPKGSKVYSDYDKMILNSTMTKTPVFNLKTSDHTAETVEKIGKDIVRAVKAIPQPILRSEGSWSRAMKTGSNFREYLNKNI